MRAWIKLLINAERRGKKKNKNEITAATTRARAKCYLDLNLRINAADSLGTYFNPSQQLMGTSEWCIT